jgi:signal transduction histidine kinase
MALAEKSNNLSKKIFLTMALADNYKIAGHLKEYSEALETLIELKDSLAEKNSMEAIAAMSAKYDLQKKENIIIQQKYSLNKNRFFAIGFVTLLLLGLVLVWALYRNYRLGQQKKLTSLLAEQKILSEKAVILAKENERKRISADLHDNLGAYAAAMTSNIKYLKEGKSENRDSLIVQLDENAQNIVTQLSETIWVLKHESLPLTTLADRFKVWLQRLMQSYPEVKYNYSEIIKEDIEFSPTNILHIFFIMKECVNNALRHSQCSEINIQIISTGEWMISIEDNGKGMGMVSIPHNRGISNIKSRAIQCGCIVAWKKAFKGGVIVTISGNTTNWVFSEMMTSHNFIPEKMQK